MYNYRVDLIKGAFFFLNRKDAESQRKFGVHGIDVGNDPSVETTLNSSDAYLARRKLRDRPGSMRSS